ncbi:MAG: type II toxin-antitoxin system VapC family toxin [Amphiplicatus sp.]
MDDFLLDTCACIWIANGDPISKRASAAMKDSLAKAGRLRVSPITAWEIAVLASKGRLSMSMRPEVWFARLVSLPGVTLAEMPPGVLIASAFLPGAPPGDPADRIIAATSREFGYTLLTRDTKLLAYADAGFLNAMAC